MQELFQGLNLRIAYEHVPARELLDLFPALRPFSELASRYQLTIRTHYGGALLKICHIVGDFWLGSICDIVSGCSHRAFLVACNADAAEWAVEAFLEDMRFNLEQDAHKIENNLPSSSLSTGAIHRR